MEKNWIKIILIWSFCRYKESQLLDIKIALLQLQRYDGQNLSWIIFARSFIVKPSRWWQKYYTSPTGETMKFYLSFPAVWFWLWGSPSLSCAPSQRLAGRKVFVIRCFLALQRPILASKYWRICAMMIELYGQVAYVKAERDLNCVLWSCGTIKKPCGEVQHTVFLCWNWRSMFSVLITFIQAAK